jgi:integrase
VDPDTKKRRYKWTSGFQTRRAAEAHLAAVANNPALGAGIGPMGNARLRLGDWMREWLKLTSDLSEQERRSRESYVRCHIAPDLGHIPMARLHPLTLERYFARRRESLRCRSCRRWYEALPDLRVCPKCERPLTKSSTTSDNHVFKLLRAALNRAVELGLIAANPCAHVKAPPPRRFQRTLFTHEELSKFLTEALRSSPYGPLYLILAATGLRPGEASALMWRNTDLQRGVVWVTHVLEHPKGGGWHLREFPKTNHSRRAIRLPQQAIMGLRELRKRVAAERLQTGASYAHLDLVFCQSNGRPLHLHNVNRRNLKAVCRRAEVPMIRLYDLRHLHATMLANDGVNPKEISQRMGHHAVAFTFAQYVHTPADLQEASALSANRLLITPEAPGDQTVEQAVH